MINNSTVAVRAKTAAWEAYSDPYEFDPHQILKIVCPTLENLIAFSDHLLVQWNCFPFSRKCHCQVKYSKAVNERTPEWVLNKTLNPTEQGEVTIGKLESCTNYRFAVRCALDKAPWSDWSQEKTVLTKLNKRDVKLHLWRKVSELEKNVRKVHAKWRELPSACPDTYTFTIKQAPYKGHMTGVNYMKTACGTSTCDVDVNQDAHRIILTVFHNGALFAEDSIYVPAIGESLPQVTDIQTSSLEGVILVSWKPPAEPVSGYMVDWTHDGNQYYWKESKYTNTTLFGLLDKKPYNITVTPLFDDRTGHGAQALQICSRVKDPGNVSISVQPYDKTALVILNVSQEPCSGTVINYTVFYSTQKGPQLNVTVDSTTQDIYLRDLKPDTEYSVYVMATALTGTTKSSERHFKTKIFDPRLITALSVCGSILIVLVLSLGLCCAVQWKKFKEMPVPNPGDSSVALWPSTSPRKPFSNPTESECDRVYMEEPQRKSTSPQPTDCHSDPASDQTDEYIDPATVPAPIEKEDSAEPAEPQQLCSPGESTALLSSDNSLLSPYRSQNSVEGPAPRAVQRFRHVPVQQEKTAPVTVYVTLDMFEQDQGR